MKRYKQRQLFLSWSSIAWHWSWSITWRWAFSIRWHDNLCRLGWYYFPTYCGESILCGLNTPIFDVSFQTQPNMARK